MTEWWTYSLEDFLLFSPRVYWRLFELHNEAFWPLQPLLLAVGVILIWLANRHGSHKRIIWIALAGLWVFVGWSFLLERYATINWAAIHAGRLFLVEAAVLLVLAGAGRLATGRAGRASWCGLALAGYGVLLHPLLAPLSGRSWRGSEIFGLAPDPTAFATIGLCLLVSGWPRWVVMPIPLLWCVASGLTLRAMGEPAAWVPFAVATIAIICAMIPDRQPTRS